jgi:hypothetical protein
MGTSRAGLTAAGVLLIGAALGAGMSSGGCTSVADDVHKYLAAAGGGTGGGTTSVCTAECCKPQDCKLSMDACLARTCENGKCGETPVKDGQPSDMQTKGDCKLVVCDGAGKTTEINDDSDPLDDGKDCTIDLCTSGVPTTKPEMVGTKCSTEGGSVCNGVGACVECNLDADCKDPAKPLCGIAWKCVPVTCNDGKKDGAETDQDCGGGTCAPCPDGLKCKGPTDCQSGVCTNEKCQVPTCSDGVKNGKESDVDCGAACPNKCGPNKGCTKNEDCTGLQCSGPNGTCTPNCQDGVTNNMETGVDCGGGTCPGCGVGMPCAGNDSNCLSNEYCGSNGCVTKVSNGTPCTSKNQCISDICELADGVCCNADCGGACRSCNLAGSVGTCTLVPPNTPSTDCTAPQECDGNGACKLPNGETCDPAMMGKDCVSGSCVDGVCCNNACGVSCFACNVGPLGVCEPVPAGMKDSGCKMDQVCGSGAGAGCVPLGAKTAFGGSCNSNSDCFSNACRVDTCKIAIGDACLPSNKIDCVSNFCSNNICALCKTDADCNAMVQGSCLIIPGVPGYCKFPAGAPCIYDVSCESGKCSGMNLALGTCQQ